MIRVFLIVLILAFLSARSNAQDAAKLDSVFNLLKNDLADSVRADALNDIAFTYYLINPDSTIFYGRKSLQISEESGFHGRVSRTCRTIGLGFQIQGEIDSAFHYYEKALLVAKKTQDETLVSLALINLGNIQSNLGDFPFALKNFQKALLINESLNNEENIAALSNNIGIIYQKIGESKKALEFFSTTLEISKRSNDEYRQGVALVNIGDCYYYMQNYQASLLAYQKSESIWENMKVPCAWIYSGVGLGGCFLKLGRFDSAAYYLEKTFPIALNCNNPEILALVLRRKGKLEIEKGNLKSGIGLLKDSFQIAREKEFKDELQKTALALANGYDLLGDKDLAYHYFKVFHSAKDSLYNLENARKIAVMEAEYEIEQLKRQEEGKRKVDALRQEQLLMKEKWLRNFFISGFIVAAIMAFLIYKNFQRKKKAHDNLKKLNIEIKEQKEELHQQSEELRMLNESLNTLNGTLELKVQQRTKELELKNAQLEKKNQKLSEYAFFNAHRLRAPVASILGLISIFKDPNASITDKDEVIERLKKSTTDLDKVIHDIKEMLER